MNKFTYCRDGDRDSLTRTTSQKIPASPGATGLAVDKNALSARIGTRLHRCAHNTAPRLLIFLICALSIFLLFPHVPAIANAASSSTGQITGQLLNGSRNNAPVPNQSVTLQLAQGNTSRDFITLTTDAQGHYSFNALQSDSSAQYAIYTLYQGAQYVSDLIDLSKNADQQVNLTVYDATTNPANLAVVQATVLLNKPNPQTGLLSVSEDFFFENLSNTTYVGSLDATQGKPNALLFSLPGNARFLTLNTGFDGYRGIQVNTGFASNAAVPPGTTRFSFSFQVPYSDTSYHFSYTPVYPTVTFSLLTPLDLLTTPRGLSAQGPKNTQSGTYQLFTAQTIRGNQNVQADLTGLPTPAKTAAPQQTQAPVNSATLWLVALLILLLALAGVGGYLYNARRHQAARTTYKMSAHKRNTPATSKKSAAPTSRETLLQELLDLDKAYEAGKLKKAAYQDQRARLKHRLRTLMSEQGESGSKNDNQVKATERVGKTVQSNGNEAKATEQVSKTTQSNKEAKATARADKTTQSSGKGAK